MHETDMTRALIVTLKDWLDAQPEQSQVSRVHLVVGQFTCVEPASLQFAFTHQTKGTFLEQAELLIRETPLVAFCHACREAYCPDINQQYACPDCRSPMDDIRSGRELKIERVEYAAPKTIPKTIPETSSDPVSDATSSAAR